MCNNNEKKEDRHLVLQTNMLALLPTSSDPIMNNASVDTPTLMMDMFNTNQLLQQQMEHPLSINNSLSTNNSFLAPSSNLSTSNDLHLQHQDLINFDFPQQQNTNEVFNTQRISQRRHSVDVDFFNPPPDQRNMPDIFSQDTIEFSPSSWSATDKIPTRHKRFLSQQYENTLQDCPLPMSGIPSRRMSMVTDSDISTWNKAIIHHPPQQRKKTKRKREKEEGEKEKMIESEEDYPVITEADMEEAKSNPNAIPRRQSLRYEGDEYTPKWVRYTGQSKEGYCDTCENGKWLQLKNSAYWYHKQFYHGISSISGHHFHEPLTQRQNENDVLEGLCHQCKEYVPISNTKRKNCVLWYRHAHKCHVYDRPKSRIGSSKRESISEND